MHDIQIIEPEPLPPFVSRLLTDRGKVVRQFPIRRQMDWRHSQLRPPLLQRVLSRFDSAESSSYLPDTPTASFYRLYQFLVVDWTIQFRNELEYFWGQAAWPLAALPDPGPAPGAASWRAPTTGSSPRVCRGTHRRWWTIGRSCGRARAC